MSFQPLGAGANDGAHLDAITIEDEPSPAVELDQAAPAGGLMTKDEWWRDFRALIEVSGAMLGMVPIGGVREPLRSLTIAPDDDQARAAADAIYDTAAETPLMRFLLQPGSAWFGRLLVVGAFAAGKYRLVSDEIRARRARPVTGPATVDAAVAGQWPM